VIDWDEDTIVGTSQKLEKRYLRLTSAPDPTTVRPLPVLKKSLQLVYDKWRQKATYAYLCDQLKSIRQDLTVQRIKNDFTVAVYQAHARLALMNSDLGEYNQCQTQLRQLYAYNLPGDVVEFTAYRILYMLHTRNSADIIEMLANMDEAQKRHAAVRHALDVRSAIATSDYHRLFKLYASAPNLGRYLMSHFVERERLNALAIMCRAYLPNVAVTFMQQELGFSSLEDCATFLCEHELQKCLDMDTAKLDTRKAAPLISVCMRKFDKVDIKGQI
ncbi:SAC3/GANP/Nin1/mts3/eIF-3 p25 family-domain-containing protein, partial [Thamnocephalis sphaerospora]